MADSPGSSAATRRTAVYSYLRPLIEGRRVLEIGCGTGEGAAHLAALGARGVVAAGAASSLGEARRQHERYGVTFVDSSAVGGLKEAGPYDAILFPEATAVVTGTDRFSLVAARELLRPGGFIVCVVPNGDLDEGQSAGQRGGLGYYDILDALTPHFARVRMFGQTPFAAFGLAEFDAAAGGLRVESGLVDERSEQPTHYVAVAGPDADLALGYALVQVPPEVLGIASAMPPRSLGTEIPAGDLRRKLAEVEGQLEGVVRVSRAQTEEIEELRARLRRAADSRAELDEEVTRLRRALTDADESVMNLTRRTTEEMTALAQRVTAGLRGPARDEAPQTAALVERLRDREAALAARESALSDRDERIAALEVERQDLIWRLQTAEEERRRAETRRPGSSQSPGGNAFRDEELAASQRSREQAIEDYRRAAAVHLDETARLREALNEQSAAVLELEEALTAAQTRLQGAEQEALTLRKLAGETEEADRARRSRLAELEGTLLRLQRQAAAQNEARASEPRVAADDGQSEALRQRVRALEQETQALRAQVNTAEEARDAAEVRWDEAAERIVGFERLAAEKDELAHSEEALRARVSELEARVEGGRLHSALAEVDRLRSALERSEEQLWEARGKLLADRERLEALERAGATGAVVENGGPGLLTAVLDELGSLEAGLRTEAAQLAAVERVLAEWRAALADNASVREDAAPPANES